MKLEKAVKTDEKLLNHDFIRLMDYQKQDLFYLLELAGQMKHNWQAGIHSKPLEGRVLGMLFMKPSTRTRVSFETGMSQLGGTGIYLEADQLQLGRGETMADTATALSGYLDGMLIRTFSQDMIDTFAAHATIPVINGLTDMYHPCQVLADLQTIREMKGALKGVRLTYLGDSNNVAHSLMIGAAMTGMDITIGTPDHCRPDEGVIQKASVIAGNSGSKMAITSEPVSAIRGADVVYTDVWTSMGQEYEQTDRQQMLEAYQVNAALLSEAKHDAIFMHCLPAHRGEEVTADVIDGKQSVVFQQAENRLHAQKALMMALMG
ncbi:ornithine carbamoyltransferase [Barrientosiimonas marina]|uniref:Ornithine carbamoyltransferase n=1 Tax=Lentibacillus kimchii TaxID=1542911 RepID=A0ABW2USW2_9BACI